MTRGAAVLLALLVCGPAWADCEADLKLLAPRVQGIADPGTKRRAERYLIRALRELDEGDELDCQPAADAVRDFLQRAAAREKAAASGSGGVANQPGTAQPGGAPVTN